MIISVSHQKGGVGKSTIAFNMAIELSKMYDDVTIIDLDVQKTLTKANQIRVNNDKASLNIIEFDNDEKMIDFLQSVKAKQIVIIDSGGFDSSLNRLAIIGADIILTPVTDKTFDLLGLQKYEEILEELSDIQKNTIISHVFLNNINPQIKNFEELSEFIISSKHFKLMDSKIRTRVDLPNSSGVGQSIVEYNEESKASQEMQSFISEVMSIQ
jgi:chromosome partitioning protein